MPDNHNADAAIVELEYENLLLRARNERLERMLHAQGRPEVKVAPDHVAGGTYWLDPQEHPPPLARKVLVLTPGGVCTLGPWDPWYVAWHPLPRIRKQHEDAR